MHASASGSVIAGCSRYTRTRSNDNLYSDFMTNDLDLARCYLLRRISSLSLTEIARRGSLIIFSKIEKFSAITPSVLWKISIRSHEQRTPVGVIEHRRYNYKQMRPHAKLYIIEPFASGCLLLGITYKNSRLNIALHVIQVTWKYENVIGGKCVVMSFRRNNFNMDFRVRFKLRISLLLVLNSFKFF